MRRRNLQPIRRLDGFSHGKLGGVSSYRAERAPPSFVPCSSAVFTIPLSRSSHRGGFVHRALGPRKRAAPRRRQFQCCAPNSGAANVAVAFATGQTCEPFFCSRSLVVPSRSIRRILADATWAYCINWENFEKFCGRKFGGLRSVPGMGKVAC